MTILRATLAAQAIFLATSTQAHSRERAENGGKWKDLEQKLQERRAASPSKSTTDGNPAVATTVIEAEGEMFHQLEDLEQKKLKQIFDNDALLEQNDNAANFVQNLMHKRAIKCDPKSDSGRLGEDGCPPAFDCLPSDNELGGICVSAAVASSNNNIKGSSTNENKARRQRSKPKTRQLKGAKSVGSSDGSSNDDTTGKLKGDASADSDGADSSSSGSKKGKKGKKVKKVKTSKSGKSSTSSTSTSSDSIDIPDNCISGSAVDIIAECESENLNCCIGGNDTLYNMFYAACSFEYATVCPNSCNGAAACYLIADEDDEVVISERACIGEFACYNLTAVVGEDSCSAVAACAFSVGEIGDFSCNAGYACAGNTGVVADDACNGYNACLNNTQTVGTFSCNDFQACLQNDGDIGVGSCTGNQTCLSNDGDIGNGSCLGYQACVSNDGDISSWSCRGQRACAFAGGDVGLYSCNGDIACLGNNGTVGRNACNADNACQNNVDAVGDRTCNTEAACLGNFTGP